MWRNLSLQKMVCHITVNFCTEVQSGCHLHNLNTSKIKGTNWGTIHIMAETINLGFQLSLTHVSTASPPPHTQNHTLIPVVQVTSSSFQQCMYVCTYVHSKSYPLYQWCKLQAAPSSSVCMYVRTYTQNHTLYTSGASYKQLLPAVCVIKLYVCMYVCMYVCTHARTYVCTYVCM